MEKLKTASRLFFVAESVAEISVAENKVTAKNRNLDDGQKLCEKLTPTCGCYPDHPHEQTT